MQKNPSQTGRSAWPVLLIAHAAVVEIIESELVAAGLPALAWYDVLWALERADGHRLRLHELAHELVFSRSNLTRLIDRIEADGLVKRARADADRRGYFAVITAQGLAMRKRIWPVYEKAIDTHFDRHLTPGQQDTLRAGLRLVLNAARSQRTAASARAASGNRTSVQGRR